MEDRYSWNVKPEMIMNLENDGVISHNEAIELLSKYQDDDSIGYDSSANKMMREFLVSKGYDGIIYKNKIEGDGLSYIAFYDKQIKLIK